MKKRKGILLDMESERAHQFCSFMWADNDWIMSHSKNLEQMFRDLIEEAGRQMGPGTQNNESVVDKFVCFRIFPFEDTFKILGYAVNRQGNNVRSRRRTNAISKQGLLERHSDIQEKRCSVKIKVSTSAGPYIRRLCFYE